MEERLLKLLGRKHYVPANVPELLRQLKARPNQQQELQKILRELQRTGQVARIKGNRYIIPREADLIPGRLSITRQGRGFLTPDESGLEEIAIPARATGTAMHEDRVLVRRDVPRPGQKDTPNTGAVVRVLERFRKQIVGTLKRSKQFLYVIPDGAGRRGRVLHTGGFLVGKHHLPQPHPIAFAYGHGWLHLDVIVPNQRHMVDQWAR